MDEARAQVEAEAPEPDRAGRGLEGLGAKVSSWRRRKRSPPGASMPSPRRRAVVLRAPVGRADDQRLAEPKAQGLQGVERRLVVMQLAGAAAGDLGRREVRPAPGGRSARRASGYRRSSDSPWTRKGPPVWRTWGWGAFGAATERPETKRPAARGDGPVQQGGAGSPDGACRRSLIRSAGNGERLRRPCRCCITGRESPKLNRLIQPACEQAIRALLLG